MATVRIQLPHHQYDVVIKTGAIDELGALVRGTAPHTRCGLFGDRRVLEIFGQRVSASLAAAGYEVVTGAMAPGEAEKNLDTVRKLYDTALEARLERKSPIIALGGGVAGDCVGFVASTYLRGVPFVQCPTTLLAMVDASVGGKVGVNVPQGKNLIGSFYQPAVVVMDPLTLATLPPRELRCGLAECVKHGVIRDAALFDWIDAKLPYIQALDNGTMVELLRRNVEIKAAVVMEDEKETGVRAHLNFGHTFAHAIEATTGYGEIEHGEAVSLGMVAASALAERIELCSMDVHERLVGLLEKIGLPVKASLAPTGALMEAMKLDKKVKDNRVRLVLPERLGSVCVKDDVAGEEIAAAWEAIRES